MITTYPAVQKIGKVRRYVCNPDFYWEKRHANRRYRRYLNQVTRSFERDPELFEEEAFSAPTLSSWELW